MPAETPAPAHYERLAREGAKPEGEWIDSRAEQLSTLTLIGDRPFRDDDAGDIALGVSVSSRKSEPWRVALQLPGCGVVLDMKFQSKTAAQLYAESRLRAATLALHEPRIDALRGAIQRMLDADGDWLEIAKEALRKDRENHAD